MNIGFFELEGWEEPIIRSKLASHELFLSSDVIEESALPAKNDFDILSVFIDSRITKEVLSHFPKLKFIATRSTGFDHIDVASCTKKGIQVSYVPGYGAHTVAEFSFGLILSLTRKIYHAVDQMKESQSFSLVGLRGVELQGKTIGIIGVGSIGKEMIDIARGFEMRVLASDPVQDQELARQKGFEYLELEELLSQSDIISIHCVLTLKSYHLINMKNIELVKRGAYLINTARGGIVETAALIKGLKEGILAGVALDVLEEEGEIKDELEFLSRGQVQAEGLKIMLQNHALIKMPNVLITPHNAFNSKEALGRIIQTTIDNIEGFVSGNPIHLATV